jgi:hypothetical protein
MQGNRSLLDNSGFPMLASQQQMQPPSLASRGQSGGYANAALYGGSVQMRGEEDFTIEKEDFPALPGSNTHKQAPNAHNNNGNSSSVVGGGNNSISMSSMPGREHGLVGGGISNGASQQQAQDQQQQQQQQLQQQQYAGAFGGYSGNNTALGAATSEQRNLVLAASQVLAAGGAAGSSTNAGAAGAAGASVESKFGLTGLLDIIRQSDKVGICFYKFLFLFLFCCCFLYFDGFVCCSIPFHNTVYHRTSTYCRSAQTSRRLG